MVSVIIPNYNHALYLEQRIETVLSQTYRNFEVIILDDCSTDNSRDIIEKYRGHEKVTTILNNTVNSGNSFTQWDKGIQVSEGNFIWIAESDDFCEPSFLEELVLPMVQDPDIAVSFCQTLCLTPDNKISDKTSHNLLYEIIDGKSFVKTKMLGKNTIINASMVVFRKRNAAAITDEYKEMKYCGDWLFWTNICLTGKVCISGKYLNYYLRHKDNVASKATVLGYDFLEGNQIYHFINDKLNISPTERMNALRERVDLYFKVKNYFLNTTINDEVFKSVINLDPAVNNVIKKYIFKSRISRLLAKAKMLFYKYMD